MNHQQAPRSIQAVIFDLDGVLADSEWLGFKVWGELVAQHGGTLHETDYEKVIGTSAEETALYLMRCTGVAFDVQVSCAWASQRLEERLKTEIEPMPGARELVQKLAALGLPLAIASNSLSGYVENALRGLRLLDYFPVRSSINQVPRGKPAPDVYLRSAELLGMDPGRCLAVEDSQAGLQAAIAAGMRVIAVPTVPDQDGAFQGAWKVYRSLEEVALEEVLL